MKKTILKEHYAKALGSLILIAVIFWPGGVVRTQLASYAEDSITVRHVRSSSQVFSAAPERLGRPTVSLVEYVDHSCTYCKASEPILDEFQRKWQTAGVGVRFISARALAQNDRSARFALCGLARGRFPEMHRWLFQGEPRSLVDLNRMAADLEVAPRELAQCLENKRFEEQLSEDVAWASELGIRSTPVFLGPGGIHRGLPTIEDLERVANLNPPR